MVSIPLCRALGVTHKAAFAVARLGKSKKAIKTKPAAVPLDDFVDFSHQSGRIVQCHNHPSGDPSPEDTQVTRQLVEAGRLLDIKVLDHVILGRATLGGFVSLKERGLGFI